MAGSGWNCRGGGEEGPSLSSSQGPRSRDLMGNCRRTQATILGRDQRSNEKWVSCLADGTNMADQEQGGMILVLCPFLLQTLLQPAATPSSFFFLDISFFKYLFLAVLGWQFFSSCSEWRPLSSCTVWASLVAEHGL